MKYILFSILFFAVISCRYNKILKGDDYEVKFVAAGEYFDKKQYTKAITLYEQYYQRFPKTDKGEVCYYRIGKAYFAEDNYYMGGYYLNSFSSRFPGNIKCEETAFYSAICTVRNSPESSLDQAETQAGLAELQNFIARYPSSLLVDTCNLIMDQLRAKLELKDLEAVRLYHKTENHNAASTTAEVFLKKYPISQAREEVYELMCGDSYYFAINSISEKKKERLELTKKRITTFVGEFPETKSKSRLEENLAKIDVELAKLKKE
jgi:outer membrane protein assembly factor BamD